MKENFILIINGCNALVAILKLIHEIKKDKKK